MRWFWASSFYLLFLQLTAQTIENLPVNVLDQSAGLKSDENRFCLKDMEGYLWFSSLAGLHKFDGTNVKKYVTIPNDSTSLRGQIVNGYLFEDEQQNIWFSTSEAIHCYHRNKDNFSSFTYPGISNGTYFTFGLDAHHQLWFYCDTVLGTFNIYTRQFLYRGDVSKNTQRAECIYGADGEVIYTLTYSMARGFPGFQVHDFTGQDGSGTMTLLDSLSKTPFAVRDMYVDGDSLIWLATRTGLIAVRLPDFEVIIHNPFPSGQLVYFNAVEGINDSTLLTCSFGEGLFLFDKKHRRFTRRYQLTSNNKTIEGHPQAIYKDDTGGVWISIPRTGLAYYHPFNLLFSSFRKTLTGPVAISPINPNRLIELNDSRIWGTSAGLGGFIINEKYEVEQQFYPDHPIGWPAFNTITSTMDSRGFIWTLTNSGLIVMTQEGKVKPQNTNGRIYFESVCEIKNGSMVLAGRDGGLYQNHDDSNGTIVIDKIEGEHSKKSYLHVYKHSDGLLYASVYNSHIDIIEPEQSFRIRDSVPCKAYITSMVYFKEEVILIGTYQGMFSFNTLTHRIDSFPWAQEISNLIIGAIVPETDSRIWVSTNDGIYFLNTDQKIFKRYGVENGTGAISFNPHAGLKRSNGELWFGSNDGITILDPNVSTRVVAPGKVIITKVLINDEEDKELTSRIGEVDDGIRLGYSKNTMSLEFASISYAGINKTEFEYRLLGAEEKWVSAGNRGFTRYSNLDPGSYIFEVRVVQSGITDAPVRQIHIQITAPLVRRPWFISFVLFSVAGVLFWIYQLNARRKRKIQQLIFEKKLALETERLRIANDMHDDLGSGLSALSLRARFLADQIRSPELSAQVNELVGSTTRLAQQIRETIWTINSRNDTIDSLVTRLHQYALDFFEGSGIECVVELMPEQNLNPITGSIRREIYLAYKESLHNVLKHARATSVRIRLYMDEAGKLVIRIQDDGRGFDIAEEHKGVGLHSMKNRMHSIGGQFILTSSPGGTIIQLIYPA